MGANAVFTSTIRVFFKKQGRIKYISHLDINRCMARALKRSGLPVWHTLGFHPHIYITFALPLSLGYESECESMDFRLTEEIPMQEVIDRLNAVFPEGLTAYRAQPALQKPAAICRAEYAVTQEFDSLDAQAVAEKFALFCAQPEILVSKRTKKGEKTIDIKPHFSVCDVSAQNNALTLRICTAAGTSLNINPTLVLDAFAEAYDAKADWTQVVRIAILDSDGKDFA